MCNIRRLSIPTNIVPTMLSPRMQHYKNHGYHSLASLTKQTPSSQFQGIKNQVTNMAL
jgi:hypothetical protein